jgi:hypothetical protein
LALSQSEYWGAIWLLFKTIPEDSQYPLFMSGAKQSLGGSQGKKSVLPKVDYAQKGCPTRIATDEAQRALI